MCWHTPHNLNKGVAKVEATKNLNSKRIKSFLGNNAIIILLVAIAIGVGKMCIRDRLKGTSL